MINRIATTLLGLSLIGFGVLFLMTPQRGTLIGILIKIWPLCLILAGLIRASGYFIDRRPASPTGGIMFAAIGAVILVANLTGQDSFIHIFAANWLILLVAYISARVIRQYTYRITDGPKRYAFSVGSILFMLLISCSGMILNYVLSLEIPRLLGH